MKTALKQDEEDRCQFDQSPETNVTPGVRLCLHPVRFLMLLPSDPDRLLKVCSTHYGYVSQDLHYNNYCAELIPE